MNIEKTEHVAQVSNFFKSLVRFGLLNHLHLLHTYQEESSKDLSVLYAETEFMYFGRALKKQKHSGIQMWGPTWETTSLFPQLFHCLDVAFKELTMLCEKPFSKLGGIT